LIGLHFFVLLLLARRRQVLAGLLFSSGLILGTAHATPHATTGHGDKQASQHLHDWQSLLEHSLQLSDAEKLQAVNAFFNSQIRYGEDQDLWEQSDYWASPWETLELGAGDCEDFALAKYFTLRLLGISEERLRLVYTTLSQTQQAHMVLGYWPKAGGEPVLLDNLDPQILPLAQRQDLQMQFAFGARHLYRLERSHLLAVGSIELLPCWQALLMKMKHELLPFAPSLQLAAEGLRLRRNS